MFCTVPLVKEIDRKGFDCGEEALNVWFRTMARQHQKRRTSVTYVWMTQSSPGEIIGFYAIAPSSLPPGDFPEKLRNALPEKVPVFLLCRMAVDLSFKGRGYGESMLLDAIERTRSLSDCAGGIGLLVEAKPQAIDFYLRHDFRRFNENPHDLLKFF
jgi:GNAT superfamily N-acetyltransferase